MEGAKVTHFPFYIFESVLPAWKDAFIWTAPLIVTAEDPSNHVLSYDDIFQLTKAFANGIRRAGLKPGDRLALWADPSIYEIVACLGTIAAGGVFVALPQGMKQIDSKACLGSCSPNFLFTGPSLREEAKALQENGQ